MAGSDNLQGTPYKYHVYLAACFADQPLSQAIIAKLRSNSLHVCEFVQGHQEVEKGISQSKKVVLLLSTDYLQWDWSQPQLNLISERVKHLIPEDIIIVQMPGVSDEDINLRELGKCHRILHTEAEDLQQFADRVVGRVKGRTTLRNCEATANIGAGMAFAHFYGYLSVILPGMAERVKNSGYMKGLTNRNERNMSRKFFIIIPASLKGLPSFSELSQNIKSRNSIKFTAGRGGNEARDYSTSVHMIKDDSDPQNEKEFLFIGDIPNILINLYDMQEDRTLIDPAQKRLAIQQFYCYLSYLLEKDPCCKGQYAFIYHDDMAENNYQPIDNMILHAIRTEISQDLAEDCSPAAPAVPTSPKATFCEHSPGYLKVNEPMSFYEITSRGVSHALIINNRQFSQEARMNTRDGSDVDEGRMKDMLERLGFLVMVLRDLTAEQMQTHVAHYVDPSMHEKAEAFALVIMTHGENAKLIGTCGGKVNFVELANSFGHCLSLSGKPKLFFVEACQTVTHEPEPQTQSGVNLSQYQGFLAPSIADCVASFSTVPGHVAYRDPNTGTLFIQALCDNLEKHAKSKCLSDILKDVKGEVTEELKKRAMQNGHLDVDQFALESPSSLQVPCFFSTTDKHVSFGKVYQPPDS